MLNKEKKIRVVLYLLLNAYISNNSNNGQIGYYLCVNSVVMVFFSTSDPAHVR